MHSLEDFDFVLPKELIAQLPAQDRENSKLLYFDSKLINYHFYHLPSLLKANDLLIINNTKVIPSYLKGMIDETKITINLIKNIENGPFHSMWQVLGRPAKKIQKDKYINFCDILQAKVIEDDQKMKKIIFNKNYNQLIDILNQIGQIPLPPYIKRQVLKEDITRYQTIYAKNIGSVAAPTAGLHFSPKILEDIKKRGVEIKEITLHIGGGTFLPIYDLQNHIMHSEYFNISQQTIDAILETKKNGGRVIAVGTTTVRALESVFSKFGQLKPYEGYTDIFIKPPYKFNTIDCLITNFHLPKSTLFMLICAFGGVENMQNLYRYAIDEKYRFFSYGDVCFLNKPNI